MYIYIHIYSAVPDSNRDALLIINLILYPPPRGEGVRLSQPMRYKNK